MRLSIIFHFLMALLSCQAQSTKINVIDLKTFRHKVIGKNVQLVDIRTKKEYEAGYIDDAIRIGIADKTNFKIQIEKLDKHKPIYIYCYSGVRTKRASRLLEKSGFLEIYDFSGGWKAWTKQY